MEGHRKSFADDINLIRCISAEDTTFEEKLLLNQSPDWKLLIDKKLISENTSRALAKMPKLLSLEQVAVFKDHPELSKLLIDVLKKPELINYRKYIVTLVYHIVKSDTSVLRNMLDEVSESSEVIYDTFTLSLSDHSVSTADKYGFLLTSLITSKYYMQHDFSGNCQMSVFGRLDSLKNLLKLDLSNQATVYAALFCCWLITFSTEFLEKFAVSGILKKVCNVLRESKTEKIVRISVHCVANCLNNDSAVEVLVQQNAVHRLTLLEYEKWRDEEIYSEIRSCLNTLQNKIRQLSNFSRYLKELETGYLTWSFLHSEKYWRENYMHFETDEFYAIKKLVELLQSNDSETLAVSCFDLGEFARLYPAGKKLIKKFNVKEKIMLLLDHRKRYVNELENPVFFLETYLEKLYFQYKKSCWIIGKLLQRVPELQRALLY